jgi:hypothetical protein
MNIHSHRDYDFNPDSYTLQELESILQLPPHYNYDVLHQNMIQLKEKLMENDTLDNDAIAKTLTFLHDSALRIMETMKKNEKLKEEELQETKDFHNRFLHVVSESFLPNYHLDAVPVIQNDANHFIQDKKGPVYSQSYPGEYYPGVINPLKKRTSRQFLNVDTRFRDNYYGTSSTNFNFTLPMKFSSVVSVQLNAFETVLSSYCISSKAGNQFFTIVIGADTCLVVVPDGNYSLTALTDFLNHFVGDFGGEFAKLHFMVDLSADGVTGTGKMIVGILEPYAPFPFSLNFQADIHGVSDHSTPLPLKLGWLLGFRNAVYVNHSTYVSEGIVDLKGLRYFYLVFNDYNNNVDNNYYSAFNSSVLNKNILARISVLSPTVQSFSLLAQSNMNIITFPRQYYGPVDIQKLNIQLLDEYGRVIQLNHMDYSFCVTLQTIYDL